MDVRAFWKHVLNQEPEAIRAFFHADAHVNWHCTNERFTVEEYIRANCEYPGAWVGEVARVEQSGDLIISVARVYPSDHSMSFHAVSFIRLRDGRIASMDEYWSDDGDAPAWRREMRIGAPIR